MKFRVGLSNFLLLWDSITPSSFPVSWYKCLPCNDYIYETQTYEQKFTRGLKTFVYMKQKSEFIFRMNSSAHGFSCDECILINIAAYGGVSTAYSIASVFRDQRLKSAWFCYVSRIRMNARDNGTKHAS